MTKKKFEKETEKIDGFYHECKSSPHILKVITKVAVTLPCSYSETEYVSMIL